MDETQAVEIERLVAAARDSLTDDMVSRLAGAIAEGLDFLDRFNRSGVAAALPAIAELSRNGDLERLARMARVVGAAEDAVTEDMVARLSDTMAAGLSMLDGLNRVGVDRVVASLERVLHSLDDAAAEQARRQRSPGGIGGMYRMLADPENQETLRFLLDVGKRLRSGRRA